jgi:hypothetical protein
MASDRLYQFMRLCAALVLIGLGLTLSTTARAQDCNTDIAGLTKKRQNIIDELNRIAKASPKGQLDPMASCPKLRALVGSERALVAYLTTNKDWCAVPDDAVQNLTATAEKSRKVADQACNIAIQMKKAQQQQAAGGLNAPQSQKLPTGPL